MSSALTKTVSAMIPAMAESDESRKRAAEGNFIKVVTGAALICCPMSKKSHGRDWRGSWLCTGATVPVAGSGALFGTSSDLMSANSTLPVADRTNLLRRLAECTV